MRFPPLLTAAALLCGAVASDAAVVGTNGTAVPLSPERVADLPEWKAYLERSVRLRDEGRGLFKQEMEKSGMTSPTFPVSCHNAEGVELGKPREWYGGPESVRIASNIASFQTPAGGWCKNTDFSREPRRPGEFYGASKGNPLAPRDEKASTSDPGWAFAGTFDNDSTTTELHFLAKVLSAQQSRDKTLEASFLKGIDYILSAQYPNGGWPQVFPLQGGYHDAVTFNDGVMQHLVEFLRQVSEGRMSFAFVPQDVRERAGAAWKRGLDCILKCQVKAGGVPTVWCQQYDPLTLEPCPARNYEMPALCASESASLVIALMNLPEPDAATIRAVGDAARWFESSGIKGKEFVPGPDGRVLRDCTDTKPIWARFYSITSGKPVFGDRDHLIHDDVSEISKERRDGYAWFVNSPRKVLDRYPYWLMAHHVK
jgi:PelA/Pel-15E family pectate lyase